MRKIIPEITELVPNNIAIIEIPAWADTLFIVLLCGIVILAPFVALIIIFLQQKIRILKEDKLLRISFSFIIYSAAYLVFIIVVVIVFESIDHWSTINSFIPGTIFSFGGAAYGVLVLGGLCVAASLLVGNLIWFLSRRKKIIKGIKLEGKSLESESAGS